MRSLIIGLLGTAALAATPALASAETISETGATVTVTAAPGELNELNEQLNATNLRFTDNGENLDGSPVVVTAVATCMQVTANSVDCPPAGVTSVVVGVGDQDDNVSLNQLPATVALTLDGGDGADDLQGGPGPDAITGDAGRDEISGNAGNDVLDGGSGDDDISGNAGNDTITGDSGNDELEGDQGDDSLSGGDGDDELEASAGNDVLSGGAGTDIYDAEDIGGNQTISLDGVANDTSAEGTANVLPDIENVETGGGDDSVTGSAANNFIDTEGGDDVVNGGDGNDDIDLGDGNDIGVGAGGNDELFGGDGDDVVDGGPGNDFVDGNDGNDALTGDDGNDVLESNSGSDTISGGTGIDTITYNYDGEDGGGISASLDGVANDGAPGENQNIGTDVENIIGSDGPDVITGSPGVNDLDGEEGDDVINSRDLVDDLVQCGPGFDTVIADGFDAIDHNTSLCELVDLGSLTGFGPGVGVVFSTTAHTAVRLTATCLFTAVGFCQGTVSLSASGHSAGSTSFFLQPGQTLGETIKLSTTARKSLAKHKKLKVTATINAKDARGASKKTTATKTLKT
jgi:Ca2+-binding RTX toxin-like protein